MLENIKQFFKKKPRSQNPYVKESEGQKVWNDRYFNMKDTIHHWQWAFLGSMIVLIIFAFVIAKMASESRVEPFVVETKDNAPYEVKPMQPLSIKDSRLIHFAVNQFIV